MSNLSETLTEVKTDILHASISLDNEKKQRNQKDDAARMLKARRAIEQHLEQKRLHHDISNGWDD
ncbi:PA3496 family putative envelope integrity protein [Marinomonas posidonica]|uniref:PA3496 family putative envelope integrity protein n=1 Tax=Marinomonas posidonica TaxID=936476 RepID=UPI003736842E